jgi:hypothetical protein
MSDLLIKTPLPYEPKRKNRWVVRFEGEYKEIPQWLFSKTTRPKWESDINGNWSDINISLRDNILNSTSETLMKILKKSGKKNKIKYSLELLTSTGVVVERWKIKGVIKKIDFGELDYADDSLVDITLMIRPTKVRLTF